MHAHHLLGVRFLPVALLLVALEIGWYLLIQKRAHPWRETLGSLGLQLLRLPVRMLTPLVLAPIAFLCLAPSYDRYSSQQRLGLSPALSRRRVRLLLGTSGRS
jgi:hypothetical protein